MAGENRRKRAVIYARYSTEKQRPTSIEDQVAICRKYAEQNDFELVGIYKDEAVSGFYGERKGLKKLLEDAEKRLFDVVLVEHTSRLSRDSYELQKIIRTLKYVYNVDVIFVSQGINTERESDEVLLKYLSLADESYIEAVRIMTKRSMIAKVQQGKWVSSPPFGYEVKDGVLKIKEDEAKWVRKIFEMKYKGYGYKEIAKFLNSKGIKTKKGKTWDTFPVRNILTNPIYKGELTWNRTRWVKHPITGKRVRRERPEEEWIKVKVPELAIVPEDLWNRVNEKIRKENTRSRKIKSFLSGIVVCGNCGRKMAIDKNSFYCPKAKVSACENDFKINKNFLEHYVISKLKKTLLEEVETIKNEVNSELLSGELKAELENVEKELAKVNKKLANAYDLLLENPSEVLKLKIKELESEKEKLERRKEEILKETVFSNSEIEKIINHLDLVFSLEREEANSLMKEVLEEIKIKKVNLNLVEVELTRSYPEKLTIYNGCGGGI